MPQISVNGTDLHYERQGSGPPLVMVHGSWGDSSTWMLVASMLAERFDLVTYDRRGHGQSTAPSGQGLRTQDEDDLVGLIEALGIAPANVAGNSFLDEERDPDWDDLDLEALTSYPGRILLSQGGQSLPWFWHVIDAIAERVPKVERTTLAEAGHVPQMTHPDALAAVLTKFFLD